MGQDHDNEELRMRAFARDELREALDPVTRLLERIADGAQAQINSTYILHGDAATGLEGFVPMVNRRLGNIEQGQRDDRIIVQTHHDENSERIHHLEDRLSKVEDGTHRIRRSLLWLGRSITNGTDGKLDWAKIGAFSAAFGGALHLLFADFSWSAIKRFIFSITHI
jgi:hypothetical protein